MRSHLVSRLCRRRDVLSRYTHQPGAVEDRPVRDGVRHPALELERAFAALTPSVSMHILRGGRVHPLLNPDCGARRRAPAAGPLPLAVVCEGGRAHVL